MSDLEHRIKQSLELVLEMADPRQRISAYHDMPYALFRYDPEEEFELRKQVTLLETRLTQKGKRIRRISLAECLDEAMRSQRPLEEWFRAEREQGVETIVETVHSVLAEYAPLVDLVAAKMPDDPDPLRDVVFILRTGALFPVYRTFSLLDRGRLLGGGPCRKVKAATDSNPSRFGDSAGANVGRCEGISQKSSRSALGDDRRRSWTRSSDRLCCRRLRTR